MHLPVKGAEVTSILRNGDGTLKSAVEGCVEYHPVILCSSGDLDLPELVVPQLPTLLPDTLQTLLRHLPLQVFPGLDFIDK